MKKKILVIEDDISIAELQRDYLEIEGFEVELEHRGDTGLEKARNSNYSLIILDLMLPGLDGFEICRNLRKETDIPLLMVSARKEDGDKIRGLGLGADDYISKPFSPAELTARVKAHIRRFERLTESMETPENKSLEIGKLTIIPAERRVLVDNDEVILTGKEFDILYYLACSPARVYTKEEIFNHIWGEETFGDISTITVHIRKIREKIESDPSKPKYLETVWGVGYRFSIPH